MAKGSVEALQDNAIVDLFRAFGIDNTEDNRNQLRVMVEAVQVYDKRSAVYGQLWQQYGALSNLLSVARKADRLMEEWWHNDGAPPVMHKDALDDAVDLLNYTVFFMRNARVLNVLGSVPDRPAPRLAVETDG